jgi:hypothetical protein
MRGAFTASNAKSRMSAMLNRNSLQNRSGPHMTMLKHDGRGRKD